MSSAIVSVNQVDIGTIEIGILALIAIERQDKQNQANRLLEKILNYRIFADSDGRMNLSLRDIQGGLLLVPQFTLAADTRKGNRPNFSQAAPPDDSKQLFEYISARAGQLYPHCQYGQFGADMQVQLLNDGPVTFILKA